MKETVMTIISRASLHLQSGGIPVLLAIAILAVPAIILRAETNYVAQGGQTPAPNYTSWATAASNIQDAVNVAAVSNTVLVSNGIYNAGSGVSPGGSGMTNRVLITQNGLVLRATSTNPLDTLIVGSGPVGPSAVRCVGIYATNVVVSGFTLTNGATLSGSGVADDDGGGVYSTGLNIMITNCIITGCIASDIGGGASICYSVNNGAITLVNCIMRDNQARYGGGIFYCIANNCSLINNTAASGGGGMYCGQIYNSTIVGNSSSYDGGGILNVTAYNCSISNNFASNRGGGSWGYSCSFCIISSNCAAYGGGLAINTGITNCLITRNYATVRGGGVEVPYTNGFLVNCTIVSNTVQNANSGGGIYGGVGVTNCIVWDNRQNSDGTINNWTPSQGGYRFAYTCVYPLPDGPTNVAGNIATEPMLTNPDNGNYRLQSRSPCVNAGINQDWMTNIPDLDGRKRIRYGTVDMGAYETIHEGTVWRVGF